MTIGAIGSDGDALVQVAVARAGSEREREIEAVLDTGFNGFLALPYSEIERLNLDETGRVPFMTASGEAHFSSTFEATVVFAGRRRAAEIVEAAEPLVGVELLWGFEVRLAYREGGRIALEKLQ